MISKNVKEDKIPNLVIRDKMGVLNFIFDDIKTEQLI
jgi:hypothetical protein